MDNGGTAFDIRAAILYARIVSLVYETFKKNKKELTPQIEGLPEDVEFVAWVQMRDFILWDGRLRFYGVIVRYKAEPSRCIMAIRGTSDPEEWWDDFNSMSLVAWPGTGKVGHGFDRIYRTLQVVYPPPPGPSLLDPAAAETPGGTFAEQVAEAVTRAGAGTRMSGEGAPTAGVRQIEVTGHSLGSALATLYVAENAISQARTGVQTPVVYTFASPRVGDADFASAFDALSITSWRVVNEIDVIPHLPPARRGFRHVGVLYEKSSEHATRPSWSCFHSLQTYMHMLDGKIPIDLTCAPGAMRARTAEAEVGAEPGVPPVATSAKGTTVTITITVSS